MIQRGKDHSGAGGAQRSTPHMTQGLRLAELQWAPKFVTEWLCSQEGRRSSGWAWCSMSAMWHIADMLNATDDMSAFGGKADIPDTSALMSANDPKRT